MKKKDTFFIVDGAVNANYLEDAAEELRFAIRKGYSDQTVLSAFENVKTAGGLVKTKLGVLKVVV